MRGGADKVVGSTKLLGKVVVVGRGKERVGSSNILVSIEIK